MASEMTATRLRALAETHSAEGKVLSLFVDLDPHEFPTPAARATRIRALLDEAGRRVRDHDELTAAEREALDADVARAARELSEHTGARGLALFASQPAGLFEVLELPHAVAPEVRIADRPALGRIARLASRRPFWIVLADRRHGRILSGTEAGLVEHHRVEHELAGRRDQGPSGARDQGGTSHERHRRSAGKDVADHLRGVVAELQRLTEHEPVAAVIVGGPTEAVARLRELLPPDLARAVGATIDIDVWLSSTSQVLAAAAPAMAELERAADEQAVAAIGDAIGTGRGAAGLTALLEAVNSHSVARLAVVAGRSARGVRCDRCGWLGLTAGGSCPLDGTVTTGVEDVVEEAVARALAHGAEVTVLPAGTRLPAGADGVAAALRF